ncbi:MAG: polysaccharide pyruvyl transferase family protein [Desulfuromonadales bacterium]
MAQKILTLNNGSRCQNWGLQACTEGLLHIIAQENAYVDLMHFDHAYMHRRYSFEPRFLGGKKLFAYDSRVAKKYFPVFHVLPRVADEFEFTANLWLQGKGGRGADEFLEKARGADAVIFNAEGSTYRDNNICALKGLFMLWFAKTKLGKRALFLNGSVTLTRVDATLPAMVKKVFSAIDMAAVREPDSYQNILEYYPELEGKICMVPDSTYALELEQRTLGDCKFLDLDFFALSLSMLPVDFRRTRGTSSLVHMIQELKKIVPNVVLLGKDKEDQILNDAAQLTGSFFIGPSYDYQSVLNILKRAKFIVSGRYHNAIFATKVGCPVIPLHTSSQKIYGLASLFNGIMPKPVDPTDLWSEEKRVLSHASAILEQGDSLRTAYQKRAAELRKEVLRLSGSIRDILDKTTAVQERIT